jgi:OmcA/MtrC family decaheme c-type cytochrome
MKHWATLSVLPILFAASVVFPTQPPKLARVSSTASRTRAVGLPRYAPDQMESYWTDQGIAFIRPGLKVLVDAVTIGSDRKASVEIHLADNLDQPLDRLGRVTPGPISLSFVLSWYDPATQNYTSYVTTTQTAPAGSAHPGATAVQAAADSGGTFTDLQTGHATYVFGNALPAGFDGTKTHTLGIYATRSLTDIIGKDYFANTEVDFRPDGNAVTARWDEIRPTTSCNNCHDPLSAHGGSRQDVKLCVLCHSPQSSDAASGNTLDFKVMIHKIHRGRDLPSVQAGTPYQIFGPQNVINDFSTVRYPQDVRGCAGCHEGSDPANKPSQSSSWFSAPARAACGGCHDDLNFATGANHAGGKQADDSVCAKCHITDSGLEYDASVKAAHVVPTRSRQLKGLTARIVSMANFAPGKKPTVVFDLRNNDGTAVDGTKLTAFAPMYAGPTSDYKVYVRESALAGSPSAGSFDPSTGFTTYTFNAALPADAAGTWSATADIERAYSLLRANRLPNIPAIETAVNPVGFASVDGSPLVPRRTVVTLGQCNTCHDSLNAHGGQSGNTSECVLCHNPVRGDGDVRPSNAGQPESISFQRMVHRIHRGQALTQDFTLYDTDGSVHNFNSLRFPGDNRDCAKCHTAGSTTLPLAAGGSLVTTLRDYYTPQAPTAAACLGCHDRLETAAHAYINTTTFGGTRIPPAESCATCHGPGKDTDVAKVHAR